MRPAKPDELKTHAYPVLTAAVSGAELSRWFPVPFHYVTDPQEAAEPSKAAVVRLDTGEYFVLYYGEISNQLMLRIPTSTDPTRFLTALLKEVPLPRGRITWRRQDARLPRVIAAKTVTATRSHSRRPRAASRKKPDGR